MSEFIQYESGREGARTIRVWDPLVRLIHWSVVLGILLNAAVTDPEGQLHEYVGYAVLGLVLLRLAWGVLGPAPARFSAFPFSPNAAVRHVRDTVRGDRSVHLSHNPLGALMVYNIWMTVGVICATGIMMGTAAFFGVGWVEDAHELAFNWLILSVLLHVLGVLLDQRRTGVALVKAMVSGDKNIPDGWSTK
ncbi:cytochrome b/b6 domain-containing protein [Ruegeria arenilitoris]|uniref:cytochrome b/b6 domain-containing protein n=1 Tax=Ruegeria arenilitoris TaxID=1173585 RepID=UPI00147CAE17|nr:cytochrome b/b6 domain-containing protein [Ruegeria arenilitoris]